MAVVLSRLSGEAAACRDDREVSDGELVHFTCLL
nr:MAG TPA: hypothetical protein [Caudoviricetes sp.]DAW52882.1 MAG TPA: hypothetical protein [Bacteriophage sp.]